ncbi:MAG: STAS domain-containing protein [Alphaproteobacteria bacterium]|nr:STAS domain-containing protein [Alphaproteobacteria bacterium]
MASRIRLFAALGGVSAARMPADVMAGLALVAIALPEQMATARLMGLPPAAGLVAFAAGTLAFAALGTHRSLSVGADSTIAPIMAAGLATIAALGSTDYAVLASLFAMMTGLVLILSGALRLGWIADLLSIPVTAGFMVGIAAHVILGALPPILGIGPASGSLPEQVAIIAGALGQVQPATLALGLGVAGISLGLECWKPRLPGPLIAIGFSVLATWALGRAGYTVPMLDPLSFNLRPEGPAALWHALPDWQDMAVLIPLALIVALVTMMQTAAVLQSTRQGQLLPANPDRDFAAVGAGSVLAGLLGSFAVDASPPRTAIAEEAGARSQWSGLVAVMLTLGVALLAADTFVHIPRAGLNGVLLAIGIRLIRPRLILLIRRRSPAELALAGMAAVLVITLPIVVGVGLAVVMSLLHAIYGIVRPPCTELGRVPGTTIWWWHPPGARAEYEPGVLVLALGAPIYFMNARYILKQVEEKVVRKRPRLLVLDASAVVGIDFTGSQLLQDEIALLKKQGVAVALARLESGPARSAATRTGLIETIGADRVFLSVEDAVRALWPTSDAPKSSA